MHPHPTDLPWLLAAPDDFRTQVRALAGPDSVTVTSVGRTAA